MKSAVLMSLAALLAAIGYTGLKTYRAWHELDRPPEGATGWRTVNAVQARKQMVVAAHPEAARIGHKILQAGGSAADAAVGVQVALTLVEPQSSGIGGGAFLLSYAPTTGLTAYDGRETAPKATQTTLWWDTPGNKPMAFWEAMVGGLSVGTPGALHALARMHRDHGRLPWPALFEDTIVLAEKGFVVTPRLHALIRKDKLLSSMPGAQDYFFTESGKPLPVGSVRKNPKLAQSLRMIASKGPKALYGGALGQKVVDAVQHARKPSTTGQWINLFLAQWGIGPKWRAQRPAPGNLSLDDLATYQSALRKPVCVLYRTRYKVCGFGPPTGGGVATLQMLKMLERFDMGALPVMGVEAAHLLAEAGRLAFADRDRWLADPDHVAVPLAGLLDDAYLHKRSLRIRMDRVADEAQNNARVPAGMPQGALGAWQVGRSPELPSTSHFCIADAFGHVVSATSSIEYGFGSHVFVEGFLLNNQLTDFSFAPTRLDGQGNTLPIANAPGPRKRPRSSMAPTLVLDAATQKPLFALGSPGGSRIIGYVAQALVALLDWQLSPQQAAELPHVVNRNGVTEIENQGFVPPMPSQEDMRSKLEALGHHVRVRGLNSGLHMIRFGEDGGLQSGIDPRREGAAFGD